ncbi:hypothetical protein [Desulforamulus ruminis]|uniref:Uncharacterized protein n=1 Tax=Desulforamulus ruminis (strain ATCC 23193 / DSM 2154 / NCIMB 8452 / DL) TaxID=696281 RepID=F6DKV9_DESRL|nr:hypothetical protein [Desulforamulus ruminis]AEG61591.1 hypothetical protein Desru_3387 [Desulforamulus ruminis DSM 2154]
MNKKEQLYVSLMVIPPPEDCEAKFLIDQGYLTKQGEYTPKALEFMTEYIEHKKEPLYRAIIEAGEGARRSEIMERAGIRQMGVFADTANKLVEEGRLRKEKGKYYPVK